MSVKRLNILVKNAITRKLSCTECLKMFLGSVSSFNYGGDGGYKAQQALDEKKIILR